MSSDGYSGKSREEITASFSELLSRVNALDQADKKRFALDTFKKLRSQLKKIDPDTGGAAVIWIALSTGVAADGKIHPQELDLLEDVKKICGLSMTEEETIAVIAELSDEDCYALMREMKYHLSGRSFGMMLTLIMAVCSIDREITREELVFMEDMVINC